MQTCLHTTTFNQTQTRHRITAKHILLEILLDLLNLLLGQQRIGAWTPQQLVEILLKLTLDELALKCPDVVARVRLMQQNEEGRQNTSIKKLERRHRRYDRQTQTQTDRQRHTHTDTHTYTHVPSS